MNKEQFQRWYDKDSGLREFMQSIQALDEYSLYIVAKEFLQIIMKKYAGSNDVSINTISSKTISKYNRWYDWNYDLHTCVEYLRDLSEEERKDLVKEFKEVCIQHLSNYYENEEVDITTTDDDENV